MEIRIYLLDISFELKILTPNMSQYIPLTKQNTTFMNIFVKYVLQTSELNENISYLNACLLSKVYICKGREGLCAIYATSYSHIYIMKIFTNQLQRTKCIFERMQIHSIGITFGHYPKIRLRWLT